MSGPQSATFESSYFPIRYVEQLRFSRHRGCIVVVVIFCGTRFEMVPAQIESRQRATGFPS